MPEFMSSFTQKADISNM